MVLTYKELLPILTEIVADLFSVSPDILGNGSVGINYITPLPIFDLSHHDHSVCPLPFSNREVHQIIEKP